MAGVAVEDLGISTDTPEESWVPDLTVFAQVLGHTGSPVEN